MWHIWIKSILLLQKKKKKKKKWPLFPDFCYSDVLVIRPQSAPESEKLRWVNNSFKLNKQPVAAAFWEEPSHLVLLRFLANFFFPLYFFTHNSADKMIQIVNRHWKDEFYKIMKIVYLQCLIFWGYNPGGKIFLYSEVSDLLSLKIWNTWKWTSFNCHLIWAIKVLLLLMYVFSEGLLQSWSPYSGKEIVKIEMCFPLRVYHPQSPVIKALTFPGKSCES